LKVRQGRQALKERRVTKVKLLRGQSVKQVLSALKVRKEIGESEEKKVHRENPVLPADKATRENVANAALRESLAPLDWWDHPDPPVTLDSPPPHSQKS